MLTPKDNFLQTIRGGHPDRLVKQFEFMVMPYSDPYNATNPIPWPAGAPDVVDLWGITWSWPEGTPGPFPVHGKRTVLTDIEHWREQVRVPDMTFSDEQWAAAEEDYASYDRSQKLVGPTIFPGLFEMTHCLMGMENAMMSFYTDPDEMHELIDILVEWEMGYARQMADHLHPDVVFHHDDWGSSRTTFLSPDMFREFYLDPYKKLYGLYKELGYLVIHHSDSYAATYVPFMIEMGVDVWQGGTFLNDIPRLVHEYGDRIGFLTGIDNQLLDRQDWNYEEIEETVRKICLACGPKYFCPCQTAGGLEPLYPGFYEAADKAIDAVSRELFGKSA